MPPKRDQQPVPLYPRESDEEFYIPARDGDGHSVWLRAQVHPGWQVELANIVASGKFPAYQGVEDIIRHAVYRHFKFLEEHGLASTVIGQANAILSALREQDYLARFHLIFDQVEVSIAEHESAGTAHMGKKLLADMLEKIEAMPPGDWQERYREEFYRKFAERMGP